MSKLVPCKSCGNEVAPSAKTCPHCGVKNPGVSAKEYLAGCLGVIILGFLAVGLLSMCSGGDETPISSNDADSLRHNMKAISEKTLREWPSVSETNQTEFSQYIAYVLLKEPRNSDITAVKNLGTELKACLNEGIPTEDVSPDIKVEQAVVVCWALMNAQ